MDIISYSQSKKAKKENKLLSEKLGRAEYKNGPLDIKDIHDTAKDRIDLLEEKMQPGHLSKRIADLSAHTMINLNKHNLKLDAFLVAGRYQHKEMVYESFKTQDSKDVSSVNVSYVNEGYEVLNKEIVGELHIKNIELSTKIQYLTLSDISTEILIENKKVLLSMDSTKEVVERTKTYTLKKVVDGREVLQEINLSEFKNVIYISVSRGDDISGTGSIEQPFASYHVGLEKAVDGDCIYIEAGTYDLTPIYGNYYFSSGISDKNKKLTITGEGQETVLVFKGSKVPNSTSRDAPMFSAMNKETKVCNLRADFYPKSGDMYSAAIARWCKGTFENISVFVKGPYKASYSYFNEGPVKEPIWRKCLFHHSLGSVGSDYSGSPYYENCVTNVTPAGEKLNVKLLTFNETNYLTETTKEEGVGISPKTARYVEQGEIILKADITNVPYKEIKNITLTKVLPLGTSVVETYSRSKDDLNYEIFSPTTTMAKDEGYKYIKIKAILKAGTKEINGIQEKINTPVIYNLNIESLLDYPIKPKYFVSTDKGVTWEEFRTGELYEIKKQGNNLKLKITLSKDQRVDAISYSWI